MKEGIHPNYVECTITCTCGAVYHSRSTKPAIHVDICAGCHPFFTGRQKLLDTEGRITRFTKKFGAQTVEQRKVAAVGVTNQHSCRRFSPAPPANEG